MSRLSIRPRPLDIHKKLPIVKSFKDFEDDENPLPSSTRNSQILRLAAEAADHETHHHVQPKKLAAAEIPTPQFVIVDTYERDYSCTFNQTTSYLRGRGARAEIGEFVEYDLDNEDEDWLEEFNNEQNIQAQILAPEKLESILFKLEVLDHKAREKAGVITATLGSPVPVLLQFEAAFEALQLQAQPIRYSVVHSIYDYWREKRERWQKPVLRRLQPPPPVNDTNPYNVFRPREKAHRLHTRRMQRRENNVQSFEKLRQVRRNLDQAKAMLEGLIKREEKKREVMEAEVSLQRMQLKYKHETELLLDDSFMMHGGFPSSSKFGSSEDEYMEPDYVVGRNLNPTPTPPKLLMGSGGGNMNIKREFKRRLGPQGGWLHKMDPLEPVLLFTKPLDLEKLASVGIVPPDTSSSGPKPPCRLRGRIGRGGRLIFDRCRTLPLMQTSIDCGNAVSYYLPQPKPWPSSTFN